MTCNTGLIFLADIYTDRVLMGEGYIVVTGADGHQYLVAVPGSAVRAKPIRCSLAELRLAAEPCASAGPRSS